MAARWKLVAVAALAWRFAAGFNKPSALPLTPLL